MGCKPCLDKWTNFYSSKGFPIEKAKEMGEKLMKRIEERESKLEPNSFPPPLFPYDYSKPCGVYGTCVCILRSEHGFTYCFLVSTDCHTTCPPPLPHSHYLENDCGVVWVCPKYECPCTCDKLGNCYYECDEPYVWNPQTQQCELPVVPAKIEYTNGFASIGSKLLGVFVDEKGVIELHFNKKVIYAKLVDGKPRKIGESEVEGF